MKGIKLIMVTLGLTLLSACTSKDSIYEEAIATHVQTDRHGTWTDLHFKVISLEAANCTVADSIRILVEDAKQEKEAAIALETKRLNEYRAGLEKTSQGRHPSASMKQMYRELIAKAQQRLDSLKVQDPNKRICYEGLEPDKVLAVYVTCKYGIHLPGSGAYQERTDTFILTPDGNTVIGKEKKKKKENEH